MSGVKWDERERKSLVGKGIRKMLNIYGEMGCVSSLMSGGEESSELRERVRKMEG